MESSYIIQKDKRDVERPMDRETREPKRFCAPTARPIEYLPQRRRADGQVAEQAADEHDGCPALVHKARGPPRDLKQLDDPHEEL
jgi:hypothetical protein